VEILDWPVEVIHVQFAQNQNAQWSNEMGFGAWIRTERERAGVTLNDFSRRLEISPAYWSRIEREMEKAPKDELILKACAILGLSMDNGFIKAQRLPPDIQKDLPTAVRAYRKLKETEK
jgi:HTH-type transcriptional regulator, competence development regulator